MPVNTAQVLSVEDINIRLAYDNGNMLIFVNEQDVSTAIGNTRSNTALVSQVAAISEVRQKMVELQRKMAQEDGSVLMDGRDIGTCVLPNADLKIYLTASADERANRRAKEMRKNFMM